MTVTDPATDSTAIPVSVITGFLGSGKTTLLNGLLGHAGMKETAVLVNEFGEVGLDHLLVRDICEDIVLLNAGCLCCSIRGDLITALRDLFLRRVRGEVPWFRRAVIETTGLADPAPIIHTLMTDPLIGTRYRLDGIVVTVDAVLGIGQLDDHQEAVKQAAVADRIIVTKSDLADEMTEERLRIRLRRINPAAPIIRGVHGDVQPSAVFDTHLYDSKTKTANVQEWLNEEAYRTAEKTEAKHQGHDLNRHSDRIHAFCVTVDEPFAWDGFTAWIDLLIATRGAHLLRIKGLLNVVGEDQPVAIHGVQHVFHPPAKLPVWPTDDRRSHIVFITRDLGRQAVEDTLKISR